MKLNLEDLIDAFKITFPKMPIFYLIKLHRNMQYANQYNKLWELRYRITLNNKRKYKRKKSLVRELEYYKRIYKYCWIKISAELYYDVDFNIREFKIFWHSKGHKEKIYMEQEYEYDIYKFVVKFQSKGDKEVDFSRIIEPLNDCMWEYIERKIDVKIYT